MRRLFPFARVAAAALFVLLLATVGTSAAANLVSIAVLPSNPTVAAGQQQQFTVRGQLDDGTQLDLTDELTWSSSVQSVAKVSNDIGSAGLATAITPGTSTIAATDGVVTGSTVMSVTSPALVAIEVTPAQSTIAPGATRQFVATGTFSDGSTQDLTDLVTWSSSELPVATISNTAGSRGLATAVADGTTVVTARRGGTSGGTSLTVATPTIVAIEVTPAQPSITAGTGQQFVATGIYSDGSTVDRTKHATWSSSDAAIAIVSNDADVEGRAVGLAPGTTTISARDGTLTGSTLLTVTGAPLVAIDVQPTNPTVAAGSIRFFIAIATFSNGATRNFTQTATWSSSDPAVATVSNAPGIRGRAEANAPGSTQITASVGSISGSTTLTVPSELCSGGPRLCKVPGVTSLSIRTEADPRRDEATFNWARGAATTSAELGDPTTTTQYSICVWDRVAGTPTLVMEMAAPAGSTCRGRPCWRPSSTGGFRYNDPDLSPDGVRRITLEPGSAGRARVTVTAHGAAMPNPPMPFRQVPSITVQVVNALDACWGADYVSSPQRNTAQTLRAKERP